jgi:hypothetical protein
LRRGDHDLTQRVDGVNQTGFDRRRRDEALAASAAATYR